MISGLFYVMWSVVRYVCSCMIFGLLYDLCSIIWYVGCCMLFVVLYGMWALLWYGAFVRYVGYYTLRGLFYVMWPVL